MFVTCPHCGFLVALIVRQDGAPQRCPRCDGMVQPVDTAAAAQATATVDEPAPPEPTPDAVPDQISDTKPGPTAEPASEPAPDYEAAVAASAIGTPASRTRRTARPRRRSAPSFAQQVAAASKARTHWGWYAAIAGLVLLLALQLLLAQRAELARDARWRPLVTGVCSVLRCDVPAWREPSAFTMLQRSVRPKPNAPGVLAVEASFRNDARWPQPWPVLMLSLSDVDGRQVGARAFTAQEYRRSHRPDDVLLPGQSTTVSLEVVEPAPRIVAFTFDFR